MHQTDMLTSGLRALNILARYAPVDVDDLARLSGMTTCRARSLVETFIQQGYAVRFADTPRYVLTDLALRLMPPAGRSASLPVVH